jgi:hypothetical protein
MSSVARPWSGALHRLACLVLLFASIAGAHAAETVRIGNLTFVNKGLVGVGRLPSDLRDKFGETAGSGSALAADPTAWTKTVDGYRGTFYLLPDRGYNVSGTTDFRARLASTRNRSCEIHIPSVSRAHCSTKCCCAEPGPLRTQSLERSRFCGAAFHAAPRPGHAHESPICESRYWLTRRLQKSRPSQRSVTNPHVGGLPKVRALACRSALAGTLEPALPRP